MGKGDFAAGVAPQINRDQHVLMIIQPREISIFPSPTWASSGKS
jgi:hypothetical protein